MVACERQQTGHTRPAPQVGDAPPTGKTSGDEEPLLLLDDDRPLLLDDDANPPGPPAGPVADNSRCHVCHLNYQKEELAVVHARADIGCARCHGESDEHIADESWASGGNGTAPDTMFPKPKINSFCLGCHPKGTIHEEGRHKEFFAGALKQKHCTDCHGDHRLPERKCVWK